MSRKIIAIVLMAAWSGLGIAQSNNEKKEHAYAETKALIASGAYEFIANTVLPIWGSNINLTSNDNRLNIYNNEVDAYLPFYGEGRAGTTYPGGGPIVIKGEVQDYVVRYEDDKRRIVVQCSAKGTDELHNITIDVSGSGYASMTITSMSRSRIVYWGQMQALDKKTEE